MDPANYDEKLGYEICIKKLTERVWELEGYLLQNELYKKSLPDRSLGDMTIEEIIDLGFAVDVEVNGVDNIRKLSVHKGRI